MYNICEKEIVGRFPWKGGNFVRFDALETENIGRQIPDNIF